MIRLWLSRQGHPPIREQLGAQLLLGILSGKLAAGERLPSVRALARQLAIHRNTVSAVYQDLAERGWIRLQQGSGAFVAPRPTADGIDCFVRMWTEQARSLGYSVSDLQAALARISETPSNRPWLVLDPDAELARIIAFEISEATDRGVQSSGLEGIQPDRLRQFFLLVNDGNAAAVSNRCPGLGFFRVHLKSVAEIVNGLQRPAGPVLIGLVSRSRSILSWAATLLTALGFGPDSVLLRNATEPGWMDGLGACDIVAADSVTHAQLSHVAPQSIVFRIVSANSITELSALVPRQQVSQ